MIRYKLIKKAQEVQPTTLDRLKAVLTSDTAKRTAGWGLGGAVIGGVGLGKVNQGLKPGETPEEQRKRLRNAIVIGSLLGGTAGAAGSMAMPTILGPDVSSPASRAIDTVYNRHTVAGAIGTVGGGIWANKQLPTSGNIAEWLQSKGLTATQQAVLNPQYDAINAMKRPMARTLERMKFGIKGRPFASAMGAGKIGLGILAGVIFNKLIDNGVIGAGTAVTQH